ncbi:radical SAM protein [Candidatus Kuenenbacteria bacterium]|nr:radical SAM protein [Candidatus Kuenenbacteria bacterium]
MFQQGLELITSPRLTLKQKYRVLRWFFYSQILGRDIIRSVEVIHTLLCNARCRFCSNEKLSESQPQMSSEQVKMILDKLAAYGVPAVIFLGGESLTDKNFFSYLHYARQQGIITLLQTNGIALNQSIIKRLADAGLFKITITLHDTLSEKHNNIVNRPGALETILAALPLLKKEGIKIDLKTIYSRDSVSTGAFGRILALAQKNGISLNVNPFMPVGRGLKETSMFSDKEKESYLHITSTDRIITTHTKNEYGDHGPAGREYLGITPDGEILPCYFLPVSVGNIKDTDIATAQKRALALGIFQKGATSCIVAMNNDFYKNIIQELYSGRFILPVRVYENSELQQKFSRFSQSL